MLTEEQGFKLKSYLATLKPTLMGQLLFTIFPFKRKTVLKNMDLVFGATLNKAEIRKLAVSYYSHLFTMIKECFQSYFMTTEQMKQKLEFIGEGYIQELVKQKNKSAMIFSGHFGNWEFSSSGLALNYAKLMAKEKMTLSILRRPISVKFWESIIFRKNHRSGLKIILKHKAINKIRCLLKNNHVIIFPIDQHACLKSKDGIAVDFLGKKAGTFKSLALLARYTKVPVLATRSYRRHTDGKHVIEHFSPLPWLKHEDRNKEIALNTLQYNQVLEQFVLDYPEQWNWMHRRWREEIM